MLRDRADDDQLDLFTRGLPLIRLPSCGRGRGRCEAYVELGEHGEQLHCVKCDAIAPLMRRKEADEPALR